MNIALSHDQLSVSLRTVTAVVAGYLLSMGLCVWVEQVSGLSNADARALTSLLFYIFYTCFVIWAFALRSHRKVFIYGWGATILTWGLWWLFFEVLA